MEEKQFFNKVTWFSFAFSLLVVWAHSYNAELFLGKTEAMSRVYRLEHWIGDGLGQIAVPGFFMISGYLFYRDFSWQKLQGKWNRRIRSVLAPYIVWNFLYYLGYVVGSRLPWMGQIVGKGVVPFGLSESVDAIINYTYNYVFWYLYQLILLILLAPALYLVLRHPWSRAVFLGALWVVVALDVRLPKVNADALLYYSSAASLALSQAAAGAATRGTAGPVCGRQVGPGGQAGGKWVRAACGVCMVIGAAAAYYAGLSRGRAVYIVLCRILAIAGLWLLVPGGRLPEAGEAARHNFFLYATHFAFVRFFNKAGARVLPAYPAVPLVLYLAMPALVLGVTAVLGKALRRHVPVLWIVLNGGR